MMIARGGARGGAGRKPLRGEWERLQIGYKCENLWQAARKQEGIKTELNKLLSRQKYLENVKILQQIPKRFRKDIQRAVATNDDGYIQRHVLASKETLEMLELAVEALRQQQGRHSTSKLAGYVVVALPRPALSKKEVVRRITAQLHRRKANTVGRRLTESFVQKCWREVLAFERRLSP